MNAPAVDHNKNRAGASPPDRARGERAELSGITPAHPDISGRRGIPGLIAFPHVRAFERFGQRAYLSTLRFRAVFILAARHPERFTYNELADMVFADREDGGGLNSLVVMLHHARRILEPLLVSVCAGRGLGQGYGYRIIDLAFGQSPVTEPLAGQALPGRFLSKTPGTVRAVPGSFDRQPTEYPSRDLSNALHVPASFRDPTIAGEQGECRHEKSDNSWTGASA